MLPDWIMEFDAAVTVCDTNCIILYMNDKSAITFEKDGGYNLVGKSLLDCHSKAAREKLKSLITTREKNVYTIEKNRIKKIIYQAPWFEKKVYMGFVEISLPIPLEMEHFVRQ